MLVLLGIISQPDNDGNLRPVVMFSHTFKAHEVNWSAHDKELFAIVHAFDHYRHFLEGVKNPVKVYSDHRALSHFMTTTDLSRKDRHRRWAEILMPHRFTIEYRPGQANKVADGPSRYNFDDVHYEDFPLLPPSRFSEKALEIGTIDCVITHLGQNEPLCLGLQWLRQVNPKLVELLQNLGGEEPAPLIAASENGNLYQPKSKNKGDILMEIINVEEEKPS